MQIKEYPPLADVRLVQEITTLSRSTVYKLVNEGTFPAPRKLISTRVAWVTADVLAWVDRKMGAAV